MESFIRVDDVFINTKRFSSVCLRKMSMVGEYRILVKLVNHDKDHPNFQSLIGLSSCEKLTDNGELEYVITPEKIEMDKKDGVDIVANFNSFVEEMRKQKRFLYLESKGDWFVNYTFIDAAESIDQMSVESIGIFEPQVCVTIYKTRPVKPDLNSVMPSPYKVFVNGQVPCQVIKLIQEQRNYT